MSIYCGRGMQGHAGAALSTCHVCRLAVCALVVVRRGFTSWVFISLYLLFLFLVVWKGFAHIVISAASGLNKIAISRK